MIGLNNNEDSVECPLCMEPLEVDDLTFFPCTCGYQICRFCWHRIRTDENKLCPACRKEYPENPADFKPLTQEEMIAFKSQKRQRDQQRKQKITENRKHLANVRVVQKNLVFVVGLPPRLADADILKKHEYFGKYGKIHKVVINPSTTYAGVQGPSASAYVTYVHNTDALRAIQSVNNIMIDGRLIKTSLGTTKYCSHFMKNQQCPKGDCMYLHELGDQEASFTKEEMHQGKHQEYEKRLHDALVANAGTSFTSINSIGGPVSSAASNVSGNSKPNASMSSSLSSTTSSTSSGTASNVASSNSNQQKEAWPSLSVSPVNSKETLGNGNLSNGKNKKDKSRNDKSRYDRNNKSKCKNTAYNSSSTASNKESFTSDSKENANAPALLTALSSDETITSTSKSDTSNGSSRSRIERNKENSLHARTAISKNQHQSKSVVLSSNSSNKTSEQPEEKVPLNNVTESHYRTVSPSRLDCNEKRSPSSTSENSADHGSESRTDAKSSTDTECTIPNEDTLEAPSVDNDSVDENDDVILNDLTSSKQTDSGSIVSDLISTAKPDARKLETYSKNIDKNIANVTSEGNPTKIEDNSGNTAEVASAFDNLSLFDDSNSFFSSSSAFQQSLLLKNKLEAESRHNQMSNATSSHLPDLLNGIDEYQKTSNTNEWEEAFKNVMIRNNRHVEEQLLHQQHLQQQQQHHHQQVLQQQEEFLRMHEMQKRNNIANNIGMPQIGSGPNDIYSNNVDLTRAQAQALVQQHSQLLQQQPRDNMLCHSGFFGGNMTKFFDFHKSQQQLQHHHYLNSHSPQINRNAAFLENGRLNPQLVDNGILTPQSQVQKQRLHGMFETMPQNLSQSTQQQQQQNHQNMFAQNSIVDDDLGFDPFIETQKGLAELMENEIVQQQNINGGNVGSKMQTQPQQVSQQQLIDNINRARMPPPGFNSMNTLGINGSRLPNTNKMAPFGNNVGNANILGGHQVSLESNWNPHLLPHQGQSINDTKLQQLAQTAGPHSKGNSTNDWTSMDPAILSYRQYSSFPQQGQMLTHPQQQQDMFLHPFAQQQNTQRFTGQTQQPPVLPGMSMSSSLHNGPQSSQPQVNASVQGMLEFLKNRQFV
ncbi:putative uncharacterized protein DDB_G0277255 [Scaptodrosophila lebanonensis]|uniref:CCR4-NOT transcription complex subunit 4 n=1 Tax=Drosophila lebanonensis TaxID=7225 RepID=A0A6J2UA66_DROLE|nr:putative uncharacterized protein DDB_G0277255 [Scaptodrosophila lebanonensis]XP_030384063.1 putative uncharacterized protein DDB_G0277255 [Scaptodrosophila lebanonensis]